LRPDRISCDSTSASSNAIAAPEAMFGDVAWAASPIRSTLPVPHGCCRRSSITPKWSCRVVSASARQISQTRSTSAPGDRGRTVRTRTDRSATPPTCEGGLREQPGARESAAGVTRESLAGYPSQAKPRSRTARGPRATPTRYGCVELTVRNRAPSPAATVKDRPVTFRRGSGMSLHQTGVLSGEAKDAFGILLPADGLDPGGRPIVRCYSWDACRAQSSFTVVRLSSELRSMRSLKGSTPTTLGGLSSTRDTVCLPVFIGWHSSDRTESRV
jgi:hypothetical protein